MAYLGRGLDKISNIEVLDNITFNGSSSYSITKGSVAFTPNSAQSCLISIDGVVQATNFSVNSNTIDFGVAIPSTSTCNFFLHYGTGVMTVPSDGSVTTAKLGDSAVTTAKINDDAVTFDKMTGQNYPAFSSKMTSNQSLSINTNTKLNFSTELIDTDNAYDHSSNYRFTVPSGKSGKYVFSLQAFARGGAVGQFSYIVLKIFKNGSQLLSTIHNDNDNPGYGATGNVVVMDDASVGDYYEPFIFANATGLTVDVSDQGGCDHFYGYRIGD